MSQTQKPEYAAYGEELLDEMLARYQQPRESLNIPYLLKGQCMPWTDKFVAKFPELTKVLGFYDGSEHAWCVTPDGVIVDPTIKQFYVTEGDPTLYRVFNPEIDKIYLGKCMECGTEIYGLQARGRQEICSDECGDSLTNYFNSQLSSRR